MKLWKAIVKGSKLRPQTFFALKNEFGTCALGAAIDGGGVIGNSMFTLMEKFPLARILQSMPCSNIGCPDPACLGNTMPIIPHLNDDHKWSREAIAEWIKTKEDKITQSKWNNHKEARMGKEKIQSVEQKETIYNVTLQPVKA